MSAIATVSAYLDAIARWDEEATFALLAPDAVHTEWPNTLKPNGSRRDVEQMRAGFVRGKALLSAQSYTITRMVTEGDAVMVEAVWTGTLAAPLATLAAGNEMRAHCAMAFMLRDGRIAAQSNYDCFDPF